jgi:DNA-binding response OmpR family regulator
MQNLPVIILSDLQGIDQLAAKLGIFAVIKKPMSIVELVENIVAALREQKCSA